MHAFGRRGGLPQESYRIRPLQDSRRIGRSTRVKRGLAAALCIPRFLTCVTAQMSAFEKRFSLIVTGAPALMGLG